MSRRSADSKALRGRNSGYFPLMGTAAEIASFEACLRLKTLSLDRGITAAGVVMVGSWRGNSKQ